MTYRAAALQREGRSIRGTPDRASTAPPSTTFASSDGAGRCACGGGCPRCTRADVPVSSPGDALEQAAERRAQDALRDPFVLAQAQRRARIHDNSVAARIAATLGARAFTFGRDIVFGAGEFAPETPRGRRLLAHELAHVEQQARSPQPIIQRQPSDVITMEPLTVRSTLQPVERAVPDLQSMTGAGQQAGEMTVEREEATMRRNTPVPGQRLPFNNGAWDAQQILTALGQYDRMPGTDSDAIRCVQAVAMAARVVDGPGGVIGFLRAMILEGMLSRPHNTRERTATEILEHVIGRIETERATFGDLAWAQEALHDLFYNDVSGTPEAQIRDQIGAAMQIMGRSLEPMNVWCNSPQDVINAATRLQPGEQLLVNTWQVIFNTAFEDLEEQGIQVQEGRSTVVEVNGRTRRIRRIRTDARPASTAIDDVRDSRQGHQLLVLRDSTTRQLRLYEPEITESGRHLEDLATDGSNFTRYFRDLPDVGIYNYIQILGKLTPSSLATSFGTAP